MSAPEYSASGLAELRRVLAETPPHVLLADDAQAHQPLRCLARVLADDARARDAVRAERLLIELRRMWRDLPEARHLPPEAHEQLWQRLVTACIEEFYRSARTSR
jgi:hypothetical protein